MADIHLRPARQQPDWEDPTEIERARERLSSLPALVDGRDVAAMRSLLARVADGRAQVLQAGDCAEDPAECTDGDVARKAALLDVLAGAMKLSTGKPTLRVGRIAGQFCKPRSNPVERVGGVELPAFRGHLVNSPEPDPRGRRPDPDRLLSCYRAAGEVMRSLGWNGVPRDQEVEPRVWTSHEALLLDYEVSLLREDHEGRPMLGSTHWPWVGERTRQLDGAQVALLAQVANPVGCKIGADTTPEEVVELCERLDPGREKGRLTLIERMGADRVQDRLPPLVRAVREAGHPVIWLCDPMHGNTFSAPDGLKTRHLDTITSEIRAFERAVRSGGGVPGGLHLETTPDDVTECVADDAELPQVGDKYTSCCDPRLNPRQAIDAVSAW